MSNPICIIPARMGSKRLPRKNVIMCDGKPLIYYTIKAAKDSGVFDEIIVTSDDPIALSVADEMDVYNYDRGSKFVGDKDTVVDVVWLLTEFYSIRMATFSVLLPTCPLRTAGDIRKAYKIFKSAECDFVMSVTEYYYHPYQALSVEESGSLEKEFPVKIREQSQEWRTLYHHNGAVIFGYADSLKQCKDFYGGRVVPYFMPRERSVDIDTLADLEYAEYLLKKRRGVL